MANITAGLGCAPFGGTAYIKNGSVERTHKSKGYKDLLGEDHDVEVKFLERKNSSRIVFDRIKQMWDFALITSEIMSSYIELPQALLI